MTHLHPATLSMTRELQGHISEPLVVYGSGTHEHISAPVNCYNVFIENKDTGRWFAENELSLTIYSTTRRHSWSSSTIIILSVLQTTVHGASWLDERPLTLNWLGSVTRPIANLHSQHLCSTWGKYFGLNVISMLKFWLCVSISSPGTPGSKLTASFKTNGGQ